MIIDLTFTYQRPQAIAIYWSLCAAISNAALTLTPEIISARGGWRLFYGVWVGPCGVALFLALLFCPETYFHRPAVAFEGRVLVQDATEGVRVYEGWEEVPDGKPLPETPETALRAVMKVLRIWGKGKKGGWKAMRACYPQILLCMFNPMIFWVLLLNALSFGGVVSISTTYANLLHGAPYFFSFRAIAFIKLSAATGALLAWPASGFVTAQISRRLAMRNRGVCDAEHYLPSFILPVLTGAASLVLYGVAGEQHWHWIWIFISHGLNYFSFVALFITGTLWVTSAFPRWTAAALVLIGGAGFTASFGMSFAIAPWIKAQGFTRANCEIGGMILAVGCVGIPVARWGKRLRVYIDCKWGSNEGGALRPRA
jgi:hypothetical protein